MVVGLVALVGPLWLLRWQRFKKPMRGPWDLGGEAGLAGDEWETRQGGGDEGKDRRKWDMNVPEDRAAWRAFMQEIRCD